MTLLFIYNATSGKLNSLFDAAHKIISPKTYQCKLCSLTHDAISENKLWREFREKTVLPLVFYHIDEFEKQFPRERFQYPVILLQNNNKLTEWISKDELEKIVTTKALIYRIQSKAATMNPSNPD